MRKMQKPFNFWLYAKNLVCMRIRHKIPTERHFQQSILCLEDLYIDLELVPLKYQRFPHI